MGTKTRLAIVAALVATVTVLVFGLWWPEPVVKPRETDGGPGDSLPLTPPAATRFLNTQAQYVGSQACRECHQDETDSFAHSGMSRSMRTVDLDAEPPDASFPHTASERLLQSIRRDGKLWHREEITGNSQPWVVGEHEIKYIVGSGVHFTMYLCEIDGFLVESPLT